MRANARCSIDTPALCSSGFADDSLQSGHYKHAHVETPRSIAVNELPPPRAAVLDAVRELKASTRFSADPLDRLSYARDLWPLALLWVRQGRVPLPPDGVVWPSTEDDVAHIITLGRKHRIAIIPFGAGSGVCGGTWATQGGLTLDMKRFDRIGPVDAERLCVDAGAGVMGETLERTLNAQGFTLGHFPSSIRTSTVGGWLAARSAGQFSSKYGKIEDMVLSVRAVLGTGECIETPERPFSGPDLVPLLLGSEGTFCAFTSARLRVMPLPQGRAFHAFDFSSLDKGLDAIRLIFREGLRPAVTRLYDPFDTALVGSNNLSSSPREVTPPSKRGRFAQQVLPALLRQVSKRVLTQAALLNQFQRLFRKSRLVLMFEGDAERAKAEDRAASAICSRFDSEDLGEEPARAWLKKRYDVSFRMSRLIESGTFADTMEVATSWDKVLEVYERVHHAASPYAFALCHFSHAYADGCSLYFSFIGSGTSEADLEQRYHALWRAILQAAVSAGANVSHHHGVGILKAQALQESLGEASHALQGLKSMFDPDHVMNPGKLGL